MSNLSRLLRARGMSAADLARQLECDDRTVEKLESDPFGCQGRIIQRALVALGCSPDDLLAGELMPRSFAAARMDFFTRVLEILKSRDDHSKALVHVVRLLAAHEENPTFREAVGRLNARGPKVFKWTQLGSEFGDVGIVNEREAAMLDAAWPIGGFTAITRELERLVGAMLQSAARF